MLLAFPQTLEVVSEEAPINSLQLSLEMLPEHRKRRPSPVTGLDLSAHHRRYSDLRNDLTGDFKFMR